MPDNIGLSPEALADILGETPATSSQQHTDAQQTAAPIPPQAPAPQPPSPPQKPGDIGADANEYAALRKQNEALTQKLLETAKTPVYKNEMFYKLDALSAKDQKAAERAQQLIFGSVSPKEILKLAYAAENKDVELSEDEITRQVERRYPALFGSDADEDSQEYKNAIIDMRVDAAKAKNSLLKELNEIEVPTAMGLTKEQLDKQLGEAAAKWKPTVDSITEADVKLNLTLYQYKDATGSDKTETFEVEIDKQAYSPYLREAVSYFMGADKEPSQDAKAKILELANKMYVADNFEQIVRAAVTSQIAKQKELIHRTIHNPAPIGTQKSAQGSGNISPQDELGKKVLSDHGI